MNENVLKTVELIEKKLQYNKVIDAKINLAITLEGKPKIKEDTKELIKRKEIFNQQIDYAIKVRSKMEEEDNYLEGERIARERKAWEDSGRPFSQFKLKEK